MGTRCTVHFVQEGEYRPIAIVYRQHDGHPNEAGQDLCTFLAECEKLSDDRLDDPSYLAARYVVWLAQNYWKEANKIDFISVGIVNEDPSDIEYRYVVRCDRPTAMTAYSRHEDFNDEFVRIRFEPEESTGWSQ